MSVTDKGGLGCGEGGRAAGTPGAGAFCLRIPVPCAVGSPAIACASNKPLWVSFLKDKKKKDPVDNLKKVS